MTRAEVEDVFGVPSGLYDGLELDDGWNLICCGGLHWSMAEKWYSKAGNFAFHFDAEGRVAGRMTGTLGVREVTAWKRIQRTLKAVFSRQS